MEAITTTDTSIIPQHWPLVLFAHVYVTCFDDVIP